MTRFASDTSVSVERSKAEIERLLMRYGATQFATGWDASQAVLGFHLAKRSIRFVLPLPDQNDSAAMSLWLTECGIEHDRVFADTGWEHPATYEYLRGHLAAKLGPIHEVRGQRTMPELIRHKGMFPARIRRFCTDELKVAPLCRFFRGLPGDRDYVNAVGIRNGESVARSKLGEWEWSDAFDCDVWRPIISWTEQDVINIHRRHGLAPNPLYLMGATRVGCWPCIYANKTEKRLVADLDPGRIDLIRQLEADVASKRKERFASRGEIERQPSPTFFTLRPDGKKHLMAPIDDVVEWARSGKTTDPDDAARDGCMRWGLCETSCSSRESVAGGAS